MSTRGSRANQQENCKLAIGITLKFEIKPGASEAFETGFRKAASAVKAQDKGCELYDLYKSIDSPTTYVMVERWTTQELLDVHMKSPTMAGMAALAPHFAGAPAFSKYEVA
jgi:quinol monooxygenase YgiN